MKRVDENGGRITTLLREVHVGRPGAAEELIPLVYEHLRVIARHRMRLERPTHTLMPTELVHEAYLRLAGHMQQTDWQNRAHFFAAAAEAMRRTLVDHARRRSSQKRGSGLSPAPVNVMDLAANQPAAEILLLDEAFQRLETEDPLLGQVVRLRFFAGLSVQETGEALGISPRSVIRHWSFARAWLFRVFEGEGMA